MLIYEYKYPKFIYIYKYLQSFSFNFRVPPYSSGPLPTIPTSSSSQPPSLGIPQPSSVAVIQHQALGPSSIIVPQAPTLQLASGGPGAASLSLHGAGGGSTKSMNKIRNKTRDSPQKNYDTGNFVGSAGPSNYNAGHNRGGVLSNTLPSPRRRKDLMKELMQEQRKTSQQHQQQQRSIESMGGGVGNQQNIGGGAGHAGMDALSGLGSTLDQPPAAANNRSGPPNQNVSYNQIPITLKGISDDATITAPWQNIPLKIYYCPAFFIF